MRTASHGSSVQAETADRRRAARTRFDWSTVQAVPPDTEIEVQLHDDAALPDSQTIKGRFRAATVGAGSEVSRGHLFENRVVERLVRHQLL